MRRTGETDEALRLRADAEHIAVLGDPVLMMIVKTEPGGTGDFVRRF